MCTHAQRLQGRGPCARRGSSPYNGHAVGSCVWKCSEGHDDFVLFSYAKDFTGKEAGGGGGALCAVRVRELSQRVDLRVTCEMRGMRSEMAGLLNFGGKTDSEVN